MDPDAFEQVEIRAPEALWQWLEAHHAEAKSVLLVTWKARVKDRYVSREEVLDALVAYGWVDGRRFKLDDERTMQLISPRQPQAWARTYRERFARLEAEGRMQPAGRAALARATDSGQAEALSDVDDLAEPPELLEALGEHEGLDWWRGAAPSYRRNVLRWIATAKRPQTRTKRVLIVAEHAGRSQKVPQY